MVKLHHQSSEDFAVQARYLTGCVLTGMTLTVVQQPKNKGAHTETLASVALASCHW
jgi:hypothetical protein